MAKNEEKKLEKQRAQEIRDPRKRKSAQNNEIKIPEISLLIWFG